MIPDEGKALELHHQHGSNSVIIEHCKTVAAVARVLAEGIETRGKKVDVRVVVAGALLHDIGRCKDQTVRHGGEGADMIEHDGVDRAVVDVVRKHVGAGISAEEAKSLGLPDFDYIPRTTEERIVCFADKMVDSSRVRPFESEVQRFVKKGHDVGRLLALRRSIQEDLGEDPEGVVLDKIKESP